MMFTGLTVANVVGVPAGHPRSARQLGWRVTFAAVAALGVARAGRHRRARPRTHRTRSPAGRPRLRRELAAFRNVAGAARHGDDRARLRRGLRRDHLHRADDDRGRRLRGLLRHLAAGALRPRAWSAGNLVGGTVRRPRADADAVRRRWAPWPSCWRCSPSPRTTRSAAAVTIAADRRLRLRDRAAAAEAGPRPGRRRPHARLGRQHRRLQPGQRPRGLARRPRARRRRRLHRAELGRRRCSPPPRWCSP